jgi:hypothetical protein
MSRWSEFTQEERAILLYALEHSIRGPIAERLSRQLSDIAASRPTTYEDAVRKGRQDYMRITGKCTCGPNPSRFCPQHGTVEL